MTDSKGMTPEGRAALIKRLRESYVPHLVGLKAADEIEALADRAEEIERLREALRKIESNTQTGPDSLNEADANRLIRYVHERASSALGAEPVGDDPAPTLWCPQCFEHDHNPVATCCYQCGERLTTNRAAEGDPAPRELNCDEHGIYDEEQGPDCPACIEIRDFGSLPFEHPVPRGEQPS